MLTIPGVARVLALASAVGLLAVGGSVATAPVASAGGCLVAGQYCGKLDNRTGYNIEVQWQTEHGEPIRHGIARPGRTMGGGGIDIDWVVIPPTCTFHFDGVVDFSRSAGTYKLSYNGTYIVDRASCRGDGNAHVSTDAFSAGSSCRWSGSAYDLRFSRCGNLNDRISTVLNLSSHGNSLNLYNDIHYGGAWACIKPGDTWPDLSQGIVFSWGGSSKSGYGQSANDRISSTKWVRRCGDA